MEYLVFTYFIKSTNLRQDKKMYCKECGTEVKDGKFCPECGMPTNPKNSYPDTQESKPENNFVKEILMPIIVILLLIIIVEFLFTMGNIIVHS